MLKEGMENYDFTKVTGKSQWHGRCIIKGCTHYATHMKKSKVFGKPYYRIYCRYHATDEKKLKKEGILVEGIFRPGFYVDCDGRSYDCLTRFTPTTGAKVLGYISESGAFYIQKEVKI